MLELITPIRPITIDEFKMVDAKVDTPQIQNLKEENTTVKDEKSAENTNDQLIEQPKAEVEISPEEMKKKDFMEALNYINVLRSN